MSIIPKSYDYWVLACDMEVEGAPVTGIPVGLFTSSSKAKEQADILMGGPLEWEVSPSEDVGDWFSSEVEITIGDGFFNTEITITSWLVRPARLDQLLKITWYVNGAWKDVHPAYW